MASSSKQPTRGPQPLIADPDGRYNKDKDFEVQIDENFDYAEISTNLILGPSYVRRQVPFDELWTFYDSGLPEGFPPKRQVAVIWGPSGIGYASAQPLQPRG